MFFRFIADTFFAKRYGHRAVVLETVAAVPGMVAGVWLHMKSLRKMKTGLGPKIREMMEEADQNGDGYVDKEEFIKIMLQTNLF